ncbi:TetR/AcrR family transcriptional regulator [Massilibacterium senegalense]|uniref:TetR/AcrR family transcriptional regulator n=1 Tax=Massilibacterium senegalense TaxID=1632858 RepID=UPI0007808E90|nr:TetR/AcrR family transcriptional regulator [Massilibacterium senegalense]
MKKEEIKQAALQLFVEKGFTATALSEIAKKVGIKTPSLYAHFPSKDALYLHIYREQLQHQLHFTQHIMKLMQETSVYERLETLSFSFLQADFGEEQTLFIRRSLFFPPPHLKEIIKQEFVKVERLISRDLTALFQEGMDNGELKRQSVEGVLAFFYCVFDGVVVEQYYYDDQEYEERKKNSWYMFWEAIKR